MANEITDLPRGRLRSGKEFSAFGIHVKLDAQAHLDTLRPVPSATLTDPEEDVVSDLDDLTPSEEELNEDAAYDDEACNGAEDDPQSLATAPTPRHPRPSPAPFQPSASTRTQSDKARFKSRRNAKRKQRALAAASSPAAIAVYPTLKALKGVQLKRRTEAKPAAIEVYYDAAGAAHTTTGWTGIRSAQYKGLDDTPPKPHTGETGLGQAPSQEAVDRLVGVAGFKYIAWLGMCASIFLSHCPRLILSQPHHPDFGFEAPCHCSSWWPAARQPLEECCQRRREGHARRRAPHPPLSWQA